ncbi:MAG: GNAT family N-acetyltransferase [Roseibium sp.]|uniref:GNAT family N-acetyltransferase n=1 Tax=Roseibium sp. TaxID=1936156 RepID=UPI001B1A28A3|nr:GNAT family N-acetyltransferase [Roseibium sp.]MBO6895059.1 GNAT family N-acetyltransferase [Roseibium sp.]MBO6930516.1 GNAT family N-acetyltransferase [Roseibium sp.]
MTDFRLVAGLTEAQRAVAARFFWAAFSGKLGKVLGPEQKALAFIENALNPTYAISALGPRDELLGLAGFKTDDGTFVDGTLADLKEAYGLLGALWRGLLLDLLEREPEPGILLMDGIFVGEAARGRGVGTALLEAICAEARRRELGRVRLDVIDTNPRARSLYERFGFEEKSREETGPFRLVFGFSSATRMEKIV